MVSACTNVLISALTFVAFYALHGCWDALSRLTRARSASARQAKIRPDVAPDDAIDWTLRQRGEYPDSRTLSRRKQKTERSGWEKKVAK